jgi:DNA-binding transcriptional LysR family regulator
MQKVINTRTCISLVIRAIPIIMTLEQLRVLVKVVDAGSFTAAADVLGVQRSHISRVIAQLEAELGVTLLERTTRRQSVSEAGRAVYERAVGVLAAIEDTVRVTQDLQAQPQGHLRITCGVAFGIAAVGGWVETFLARHPQCTAEIEYASRELDLVHEGFDLAIRAGPLPDSGLAARRLGRFDYGLYASPAYAQRFGLPATPAALHEHRLVVFTGDDARPRGGRAQRAAGWARHRTVAAGGGWRARRRRSPHACARALAAPGSGVVRGLPTQPLPDTQGACLRRFGARAVSATDLGVSLQTLGASAIGASEHGRALAGLRLRRPANAARFGATCLTESALPG